MVLFKLQKINKIFKLTRHERDFLNMIPVDYQDSWDGSLQDLIDIGILPHNAKTLRNEIKKKIKKKLLAFQGENCIYCGIHFEIVGTPEREHIAPKGLFPEFTWVNRNIALACSFCNGFEKKSKINIVSVSNKNYALCEFYNIHPYFDAIEEHIELAFTGADVIITPKNGSPKGISHIALFELDKPIQTAFRGAAYLRQKQIVSLGKKQLKQLQAIRLKKYSF